MLIRRLPPVDPFGLSAVPLLLGTVAMLATAITTEGPPPLPDGQTLLVLAVLGLVPTAGANLLRVLVIRSAGPVFMSLVNYQVPLWSVMFGTVLLGEPFRASLLLGMALILSGVGLSQWSALKRPTLNLSHKYPVMPAAFSGHSCQDMSQVEGRTL